MVLGVENTISEENERKIHLPVELEVWKLECKIFIPFTRSCQKITFLPIIHQKL